MSFLRQAAAGLALFVATAVATFAHAADGLALTVLGDQACTSVTTENSILTVSDSFPAFSFGSENQSSGQLGQNITYTLAANGSAVVQWSSTVPVNFVILRSFQLPSQVDTGVRLFNYGTAGSIGDSNLPGTGIAIQKVTFCYGLAPSIAEITEPGAPEIPGCDSLDNAVGLDGSEIICPADDTEPRVHISLDPEAPDFRPRFCSCNLEQPGETMLRCDPEKDTRDAGDLATLDGGCPAGGINTRVPISIQGVQDPHSYLCFTIGGRRRCYAH